MPHAEPTLVDGYHHPMVRDLAWLLSCPDLVDDTWPPRPGRDEMGLDDDARLDHFLHELDASPQALERRVGNALDGRMGLYHEKLWQFLLEQAPGTRLLAHNLRVSRGKLTLGEIDLLYQRSNAPRLIHLEVAIKFYLGLPTGPGDAEDPARWIGPGGADSLASKLAHLRRHQLSLSDRPETREAIREALAGQRRGPLVGRFIERRLAMPGMLFQPWRQPLPVPRGGSAKHWRGRWLHWGEWRAFRDGLPRHTRAIWLTRPHWLAPPSQSAFTALTDLEGRLAEHFAGPATPIQVALISDDTVQRLFLVDDGWPWQIPLPPRP